MISFANLFLIGPMGAGKTTIGRRLAESLGLEFFDTDKEIERRTGVTVNWIFDVEGEDGFRRREEAVIEELTAKTGIVLSTGGGSVLSPRNRSFLAARGYVVYLEVALEQQLERLKNDKTRPISHRNNLAAALEQLSAERLPLYEQLADCNFATTQRSAQAVVQQILDHLQYANANH